jgi:hypothetical protein
MASLNRCWTADRLAPRGIDHPEKCLLCNQVQETIQHILVSCVFARDVWFKVLGRIGLQHLAPKAGDKVFQDWWQQAEGRVLKTHKKGFNSTVILVTWWILKHRNACVFDVASPNISTLMHNIKEDANLWGMAGASSLRRLWLHFLGRLLVMGPSPHSSLPCFLCL